METCTKVDRTKFFSKAEEDHNTYCEKKGNPYSWDPCSTAEGCKFEHPLGGFLGGIEQGLGGRKGRCVLNKGETLSSAYINGGFGFGKICLSREFTRLILLLLFPPSYIFLNERETGFKNKGAILMNFILTCLFYFPGLIHALIYKDNR